MTSEVTKRFEDFDLRPELLRALARKGFDTPMPVQNSILEDETLVEGDLLVQAKTGSGKTLAFALPLLQKIDTSNRAPQILVLSPTRELAQQTAREFAWIGADLSVRVATLVGGLDMERQTRSLREGATVIVGTPGRVLDHLRRGTFKTENVHTLVLDEGDHMLDMGFRDEMEAIMQSVDKLDRTWLFSATMPQEVISLARRYLNAPRKISLVSDVTHHENIAQRTYIIPARKRFEGLANVLLWENPSRAVLFCATRAETQDIADRLCDMGFKACAIHGEMSQRERNNALSSLRGGRVAILVATDVAARGLDIDAVSHVIQFGLPSNLEAFVHRSGRTGRAGHEGCNLVLLTAREVRQFKQMIHGTHLQVETIPAPDAGQIEGQFRVRFESSIAEHALDSDEYLEWADSILSSENAKVMVAGLLAKASADQPQGYTIGTDVEMELNREKSRKDSFVAGRDSRGGRNGANASAGSGARPQRSNSAGGTTVQFGQGRADGWEVGALLGAICRSMGIHREDVGNIRLRDNSASVELSPKAATLLESRKSRLADEGLTCTGSAKSTGSTEGRRSEGYSRGPKPSGDRNRRSDRTDRGDSSSRPPRKRY